MVDIGWVAEDFIEAAAQRQSLRRLVETKCQVVAEDGFRLLGEATLDVSKEGLLVRSDAVALLGEPVFISLCVPGGVSWIDAEGEIVRVVRGLRQTDRARGLGVSFTRISSFDLALLQGALGSFPARAPDRRIRPDYAATVASIMFPVLGRMSQRPGAPTR